MHDTNVAPSTTTVNGFFNFVLLPFLYVVSLFAFQVGLCLIVGCVGISIVWSANVGVIVIILKYLWSQSQSLLSLSEARPSRYSFNFKSSGAVVAVVVVLTPCVTAWLYYAVVEEALTTLAHLCALLLGVIIGLAYIRCFATQTRRRATEAESDEALDELVTQ